ncbi:MAG: leucine-rich repeat protein [Candidatus Cryptobacteroides sp.]
MKKNILYTLALLSVFASCAKTELPHFGGENDPDAVVISPSVAVLSSKSNPLGDSEAQRQFNEGDVITIKDLSDNEVYTYALTDGRWKPTDGKCLLWHSESLYIEASYGSKGNEGQGVVDQSNAEGIALADYMTYSGDVQRIDGNELLFTLERQQALVTVVIKSYGDQYNRDVDLISDLKICDITPYIRDANGEHTDRRDNGTVGYRYSAIVPGGRQLIINYNVGGDSRIVINPNGNFFCEEGNSYTIKLRVGKDKIEAGEVTVGAWKDSTTEWNDVTATKIPCLTFSAENEQKFKMDFYAAGNSTQFGLREGEYFEYSVGGGSWTRFTTTVSDIAFGGNKGDLRLRGKSRQGTADIYNYCTISFSETNVPVNCSGDIRTMINYTDYSAVDTKEVRFKGLFNGCTQLTSAPELPATELCATCYSNMFQDCSALQSAPELPATKLSASCYYMMFSGCTSLTSAPELKAETLALYCYSSMFYGCTALSSVKMLATDVSATSCLMYWLDGGAGTSASTRTLTVANDNVYTTMVSKGYVPELWKKADIIASDGSTIGAEMSGIPYVTFSATSEQMFKMTFLSFTLGEGEYFEYSVGGSKWVRFTNSVKDIAFGGENNDLRLRGKSSKGTASDINYYSYISFSNADVAVECTGDIRTLIDYTDYSSDDTGNNAKFLKLFNECTQLTSAPALPAETLANNCYHYMFQKCTALTSAPALPAKTLANSCYKHMFDGCTALTSAPALSAETLANNCYSYMFQGCTSLTTVPQELPATTLAEYCYEAMFNGCTSLKTAPELKATTLVNSCYSFMFQGCTNLSSVKMLATNVSASICLYNWLKNAGTSASTRTLTLASEAVYNALEGNSYYLPENWKSGYEGTTINY